MAVVLLHGLKADNSTAVTVVSGGHKPGKPCLVLLLCCAPDCFISLCFCNLKELAGLILQATVCKKRKFVFLVYSSQMRHQMH